jgi:hypothetical protein
MNVYAQPIPESVRATVEMLDQKLCPVLNTTEHDPDPHPGRSD